MSSLVTGLSNPLPAVFRENWEEENRRARGAESLSEKKAISRAQRGKTETLAEQAFSPAERT